MGFGAVVTDAGTRKIMEAVHEGKKVNITDFAVGDGGGVPCMPYMSATGLVNEIWRGSVASCHISEESENLLLIETVMPSSVGGFTIREMGIFDDEGTLFAICNTPDTQKVKISDGVVHELNLIMEIALSNIDGVELIVDPCVLMATKKDIENLSKKMDKLITGEEGSSDNKPSFADGIKSDNIVDAINEVFQSGSEAKNKLVENLIAMGISASTDETLGQLIDKVLEMTNLHNFDTVVVDQTGTSLDSYVETGIYYFSGSYTPINIPAGTNGWLLVFRSSTTGTVKQLWFRHGTANNSDHNTFVRTKTAGTWSNWTRIVTEKDISIPVVLTGTLAANKTSISFTNAAITDTATIDVYTDVFGVNPTNMTISGTKLTLTFAARSAATGVKVKISQN